MDKVKLEYITPQETEFEYKDSKIIVKSFLDFATQIFLIEEYINNYFGDIEDIVIQKTKYHYIEAECKLMNFVYQLHTNIDIQASINDIYADSILWDKVTSLISNWWQFRDRLDDVIGIIENQEKEEYALGKVLSELTEKAQSIVNQLAEISPEDIENMQKTGEQLIERLENSSVMKNPNDLNAIEGPIIDDLKDGIKK